MTPIQYLFLIILFLNINFIKTETIYDEKIINNKNNQNEIKKKLSPKEKTDSIIHLYKNDPILKKARWGFCVYNPKTNKIIIQKDADHFYIPASTNKLITTGISLSLLGENFRWKTQLDYSGYIDSSGTLHGNIYLVNNNDPTFGYKNLGTISKVEFINTLVKKIQKIGIKKINGNIVAESVIFRSDFKIPKSINKINHGNYISIFNRYYYKISNYDKPKKFISISYRKDKNLNYFLLLHENFKNIYLEKSPTPPIFLAKELLKNLLKINKKFVTGSAIKQNYVELSLLSKRVKIYTYESPEIKHVVYFINQTSNNLLADKLLSSLGYFLEQNSTNKTGTQLVVRHLLEENFDTNGLHYVDGSGLSRLNYITPIAQAKYLGNIMKKKYFKTFFESLPKAGETGTLKKMFENSIAIGKIRAKTGTLSNVKALTGYLDTKSGDRLSFSLLVNNFSGSILILKKRMETLLESVIEY